MLEHRVTVVYRLREGSVMRYKTDFEKGVISQAHPLSVIMYIPVVTVKCGDVLLQNFEKRSWSRGIEAGSQRGRDLPLSQLCGHVPTHHPAILTDLCAATVCQPQRTGISTGERLIAVSPAAV